MEHNKLADKVARLLDAPGILGIVSAGDPVLRQKTKPYEGQLDDDLLHRLVARMRETMEKTDSAVGLAAPQVGIPLRLAVMATPEQLSERLTKSGQQPVPFTVLINPSYKAVGRRRVAAYEGCLSVPPWQAVVARADRVTLTREDEHGRRTKEEHAGFAARIVQHESDHLDGTLYLDRAELRSLSTQEQVVKRWGPAGVAAAAEELGFALP
ncbi:peptide deformylase 1 [Streptomyces tendae]|uniref:peptide deformylase n=1 Tax=Streptomyces tendae TaxID=1932 RepID=UPI0016791098|nr:peptide deformylase [Streptomyces tendae]GHB13763.1 peptide deformylase 1 [Streptomyces tendae]